MRTSASAELCVIVWISCLPIVSTGETVEFENLRITLGAPIIGSENQGQSSRAHFLKTPTRDAAGGKFKTDKVPDSSVTDQIRQELDSKYSHYLNTPTSKPLKRNRKPSLRARESTVPMNQDTDGESDYTPEKEGKEGNKKKKKNPPAVKNPNAKPVQGRRKAQVDGTLDSDRGSNASAD